MERENPARGNASSETVLAVACGEVAAEPPVKFGVVRVKQRCDPQKPELCQEASPWHSRGPELVTAAGLRWPGRPVRGRAQSRGS